MKTLCTSCKHKDACDRDRRIIGYPNFKVKECVEYEPTHANSRSTHERELISRAEAIDAVIEYWDGYAKPLDSWDVMNQTRAVLETLPSASVEVGEWIPCSERLPENGHYYLWCSDMGHVQSDYYWDGFENGMKYGYNIVAWMPLPKPYEGSE